MKSLFVLAAFAAAFFSSPALAVSPPGLTDYTFTGTFLSFGTYPTVVTGTFTYDEAAGGILDAFSLDLGSTHFDLTNAGIYADPSSNLIYIGGDTSGRDTLNTLGRGADDFLLSLSLVQGSLFLAQHGSVNPFEISLYNPNIVCGETHVGDPCYEDQHGDAEGSIGFSLTHVPHVDTIPGAVPEPATWAMMLLGFSGIGFVVRRKRCQVLAPAA
jgi:hypothetical protein